MSIKQLLESLRSRSGEAERLLSSRCVVALEGFLTGYSFANEGIKELIDNATAKIAGPEQANLFTRAYYVTGDFETALDLVLDTFALLLPNQGEPPPRRGSLAAGSFADLVGNAIRERRSGMFLGRENTIIQLRNFATGYVCGITSLDRDEGQGQDRQLRAFDSWVRSYLDVDAPWYGLIRRLYGSGDGGLQAFARLWDQFNQK